MFILPSGPQKSPTVNKSSATQHVIHTYEWLLSDSQRLKADLRSSEARAGCKWIHWHSDQKNYISNCFQWFVSQDVVWPYPYTSHTGPLTPYPSLSLTSSHDLRLQARLTEGSFLGSSVPPEVEFLLFQVFNKDPKAHVWSLHAPFSSVLHTLHHLEKHKQHGSALRLRTDSLHKHFHNKSWLIHCQNLVSVEGGWDRRKAGTGKREPSMSEQGSKWETLPGFCWRRMTELIHLRVTEYYWKGKEIPVREELRHKFLTHGKI